METNTYKLMTVKQLIESNIPEKEWLVDKLIAKGDIVVITGQKASFKSFWSMYVGVCIASGKNVFDEFNVNKKFKVLYIDEENRKRRLKERITKIINGLGIDNNIELSFASSFGIKLDNDPFSKKLLRNLLEEFKPDLVICDSIVRMMVGEENSSKDVRKIFDFIKPFIEKYNCAWILIHHSSKGQTKSFRGSGDFEYMADKTFCFERKGRSTFVMEQEKERDFDRMNKIEFEVSNTLNNGVTINMLREIEDEICFKVPEKCASDIQKWIRDENITEFRTKQITDVMELEYKNNAIHSALKILKDRGDINKSYIGKWMVLKRV